MLGSGSLYCHFLWSIAKQPQSVLGENTGMSQSSALRLLQALLAGSNSDSAQWFVECSVPQSPTARGRTGLWPQGLATSTQPRRIRERK